MSDSGGGGATAPGRLRLESLTDRQRRRLYLHALVRPLVTATFLVGGYFLLPLDHPDADSALLLLVGGLVLLVAILAWQIWQILHADYPALQAIEALAAVLPFYLLGFAATYVLMSYADAANFSEPLSHMGALYFALVVFSTVGFGDITPQNDVARAVVSLQIVGNLAILAFGLRLLLAAVKRGQQRQQRESEGS
jgi:hypothetical protein